MADEAMVAVTSSTIPYLYDLPHILSLPRGFEARFRYFVDWVAPDVARSADGAGLFKGQDLILVFHSLETSRLLPLRSGKVIELKRRGPMYHLRFVVQEFPAVGSDLVVGDDRKAARVRDSAWLTREGIRLVGAEGHDLSTPLPKHALLQQGRPGWSTVRRDGGTKVGTESEPDRQWAAATSLVMNEDNLQDVPLFFLRGPVSRKGECLKPVEMRNHFASGSQSGSGFKLTSGKRYRLQLLQWRGKDKAPRVHRVLCDTDPGTVALEGKSDLVLGKYDVLDFAIRAEAPGYSEMTLEVESASPTPDNGDRQWPRLYSLRVPVQVGRDWLRTISMVVLALSGLALYAFPITPMAPAWFDDGLTTMAQLIGLGCLFAAYGGFLSGYVRFASQAGQLTPGAIRGEG